MSHRPLVLVAAMLLIAAPTPHAGAQPDSGFSCVGLSSPIEGEISVPFAPGAGYDGHWGIDFESSGDAVVAAASGRVVFVGTVVGNRTLTIDHGGGLRSSYSYITDQVVTSGQWVARGQSVAVAGAGEHGSVHFSTRIDGRYVDPEPMLGCRATAPSRALSLVPLPS